MIQSGKSGVGRYVIELVRELVDLLHEQELFVAGLESDRNLFPCIKDCFWITIPGWATGGPRNLLWHQVFLPALLKRHQIDLLHIPSYRRIVARCPIPQVVTIHDCAPFHLRDKYGHLRGFFGRSVVPVLARRCSHVLTVSHATKHDLQKYMNLSSEKISVIWNGIDVGKYSPVQPEAVRQFRLHHEIGERAFLYIARFEHPGKNHLRLIEAFEGVCSSGYPDSQLILGGADWHGADAIHRRIEASSHADRIRRLGFIDEDALPLWYASCKAMVFPSLFEGFGLPVAEALACGTRVISSDRGSLPEVGGDAVEIINPESVSDISNAMQHVLNEGEQARQDWIAKGSLQAAKFSWKDAAKQTCRVYTSVLNPGY